MFEVLGRKCPSVFPDTLKTAADAAYGIQKCFLVPCDAESVAVEMSGCVPARAICKTIEHIASPNVTCCRDCW